jgi:hypothetical protein
VSVRFSCPTVMFGSQKLMYLQNGLGSGVRGLGRFQAAIRGGSIWKPSSEQIDTILRPGWDFGREED